MPFESLLSPFRKPLLISFWIVWNLADDLLPKTLRIAVVLIVEAVYRPRNRVTRYPRVPMIHVRVRADQNVDLVFEYDVQKGFVGDRC